MSKRSRLKAREIRYSRQETLDQASFIIRITLEYDRLRFSFTRNGKAPPELENEPQISPMILTDVNLSELRNLINEIREDINQLIGQEFNGFLSQPEQQERVNTIFQQCRNLTAKILPRKVDEYIRNNYTQIRALFIEVDIPNIYIPWNIFAHNTRKPRDLEKYLTSFGFFWAEQFTIIHILPHRAITSPLISSKPQIVLILNPTLTGNEHDYFNKRAQAGQVDLLGPFKSIRDLTLHMMNNADIFHFAAHGRYENQENIMIIDKSDDNSIEEISSSFFRRFSFQNHAFAFFDVCYSNVPVYLLGTFSNFTTVFLEQDGAACIGTCWKINPSIGGPFYQQFYHEFLNGKQIYKAFENGRKAMEDLPQYNRPVDKLVRLTYEFVGNPYLRVKVD